MPVNERETVVLVGPGEATEGGAARLDSIDPGPDRGTHGAFGKDASGTRLRKTVASKLKPPSAVVEETAGIRR